MNARKKIAILVNPPRVSCHGICLGLHVEHCKLSSFGPIAANWPMVWLKLSNSCSEFDAVPHKNQQSCQVHQG